MPVGGYVHSRKTYFEKQIILKRLTFVSLFTLWEIAQNLHKHTVYMLKEKNILTNSYRVKKIYIVRSAARCARTSDDYTKTDALIARAFLSVYKFHQN